jgi:hypothetical protein
MRYDKGSNSGRCCGKPATNRLNYGTVMTHAFTSVLSTVPMGSHSKILCSFSCAKIFGFQCQPRRSSVPGRRVQFQADRPVRRSQRSGHQNVAKASSVVEKGIFFSCSSPRSAVGLWDVEVPTFPLDNRLTDGGEVVSHTYWPPFTPQEESWCSFLLEVELTSGSLCGWKDYVNWKIQ